MTVTGIIAEFNPFHNGHDYLLKKADGLKIVAMSGNFMQRGEPALVDKWVRAEMAIKSGADIVLELPFLVSVQSADYFANGALEYLSKLGIDSLTFGTEDVLDYDGLAKIYFEKTEEIEQYLESLPSHLSYPQKTQAMWEKFMGIHFTGQTPNHILALAYTKAAASKNIRLLPIKRQGAGFHSDEKDVAIASATSLRKHIADQDFVKQFSPHGEIILKAPKVSWDDYFSFLVYQIKTHPDLTQIYQVNEEMAQRVKEGIKKANNLEELVEMVSTKRYTKARVRRLLTYILVQAREENLPDSLHILGFSEKGQAYLSRIKKEVSLVTRIGKKEWDKLTQKADSVYQMGTSTMVEQNFGRVPYRQDGK